MFNLVRRPLGICFLVLTMLSPLDDAYGQVRQTGDNNVRDHVHVANALFQEYAEGHQIALFTQIGLAAIDAGQSAQEAESIILHVRTALERRTTTLHALGLVTLPDKLEQANQELLYVAELPVIRATPLANLLRQERSKWNYSLSEQLAGSPNTAEAEIVSALARHHDRKVKTLTDAFERYRQGDQKVRALYSKALKPLLLATPDQAVEAVLASNPKFGRQPFVSALVAAYKNAKSDAEMSEQVKKTFKDQMNALHKRSAQEIAKLKGSIPGAIEGMVIDQLQDKAGIDAGRLRAAADRLSDGIDLGNADSGVYLASQMIGLFDKRLGGDIQRVGTAAIQVARVTNGLRDAKALQGSVGSAVGMGAMTGGVGTALVAVSALSSMSSSEPNADELILEQLGAIRQQLIDLQIHLDTRFDRVDAALEQIYTEMVAGFDLVERQLKGIERTQDRIEASIVRQDGRLDALEGRVLRAIGELKDANSTLLLAPCKRWRETTVVVDMPAQTFIECLSRLAAEVDNSGLGLHIGEIEGAYLDHPGLAAQSFEQPHANLRLLLRLAANQGHPLVPAEMESLVVDPSRWVAAASGYHQLAAEWQKHYHGTPLRQLESIALRGKVLQDAITSLRSQEVGAKLLDLHLSAYVILARKLSTAVRAFEDRVRNGNDSWWRESVAERQIDYCAENFPYDDNRSSDSGDYFSGYNFNLGTEKAVFRIPRVPNLHPAFVDELVQLGVGEIKTCVFLKEFSRNGARSSSGQAVVRIISWFVGGPPPSSRAETLARRPDPYIERRGIRNHHLLFDVQLISSGTHSLPQQFCGIVCQPFWGPYVDGIIKSTWQERAKQDLITSPIWASEKRGNQALRDRAALLEWSLANVHEIKDRIDRDRYVQLSGDAGICVRNDPRPFCVVLQLQGVRQSLKSLLLFGFQDVLDRNDLVRALVVGPAQLIGAEDIELAKQSRLNPVALAQTAEKRASALSLLLTEEAKISVVADPHGPNTVNRTLSRLQVFLAEMRSLCKQGKRHKDACLTNNILQ